MLCPKCKCESSPIQLVRVGMCRVCEGKEQDKLQKREG